jgi:nucleoside-diphosphate-sugar epimerase
MTVLVTGGSGFLGSYCVLRLLADGHEVRTTVRRLDREAAVRATLKAAGANPGNQLSFAAADLLDDAGWDAAVRGCDIVLHVASPFPQQMPDDENELIAPARDGTLRVLRAARDAGIRRVIVTSSFAAIGYGHPERPAPFTEDDWTDLDGEVTAYVKSKTLAEGAAWEFLAREGRGMELVVINPTGILGPVLGPDYASSIALVKRLLDGGIPGCARLYFGLVDVRDVADLHVRAMSHPDAAGQRFLATAGDFLSMVEIARALRRRLPDRAQKIPTRQLPDWLVRLGAWWDPSARAILPELGKVKNASSDKARRMLGWAPRSNEDAIVATAESLGQLGLL